MSTKKEILLDVSELEAPQPLVKAVDALLKLKSDEVLVFRHRMNPTHLFNEIVKNRYNYEIIADEPNYFEMKITKG